VLTNSLFNCSEPSPSRALSKWIWIAFSLTLISLGASSSHGASNELSIETPSDYVFGTWTTGSLSQTTLSCVVAVRGGKTKNYKTKVVNVDTGDGFYLYRNGVTSSTGNERIEVTFEHTDTLQGSNPYELLYHDNYESQPHTGQDQGCPTPFVLLELGPGRGTFMADILRATARIEGFHQSMNLHLFEASKKLIDQQRKSLRGFDPVWGACWRGSGHRSA